MRAWIAETHSTGLELVRHFLVRFFDSEMLSTQGEWQKVAVGVLAALLSAGILVVKTYSSKYGQGIYLQPESGPALYRAWMRADMLSFIGLAMAVTALVTVLMLPSLFPSRRDCLAFAGLPVRALQIFQAKFLALWLLFAAFTAALNGPAALAFAAVTAGPWQQNPSGIANLAANFCATAGACAFVFFSLVAFQGLLLNIVPGRIFERVTTGVQAALLMATLGALPLLGRQSADAAWWPPVWFLRLWDAMIGAQPSLPHPALLAVGLPPLAAVAAYLASYHRYRRLLIDAPANHSAGRSGWLERSAERWIADAREHAAFAFLWKTLTRSSGHRLMLLAYGGMALGWIVKGAVDTPRPSLRDEGMYGLMVVLAPLAVSLLVVVGLRYVFSLPVSLPANWIFRMAEGDGRRAWLAAVDRFVVWCGIAPVFVAGAPAAVAVLGFPRAAAAIVLSLLTALAAFEAAFRPWRKLPFTCSYVPGKRPVWLTMLRFGVAVPFLPAAGTLILHSSGDPTAFAAVFTLLVVVWWKLRGSRRMQWPHRSVVFDECPEAAVMDFRLQPAARLESAPAQERAPLFSTLVASRGLLPQQWAEEMEEDRRSWQLLLSTTLEDMRYGLRLIRRNPLLSTVVVLTLTLGIGINAGVFTVLNGLALRPHVYSDPDSFVRVIPEARLLGTMRPASYEEYLAFRERSRSLRELAAWSHFPAFVGTEDSAGSVGLAVSCNFFRVDGLGRPTLGRLLAPGDCDARNTVPPAVIAEGLWRSRFGADPKLIGRRIDVNDRPVTVVGIVPNGTASWTRSLGWTKPPTVWVPYTAKALFEPTANLFGGQELWLQMAGRLAPGYSRSQARSELAILARQQDRLNTGRETAIVTTNGSWMRELELSLSGRELMLLGFFMTAFHLVLLLSCANVGTLLLARASARKREIAVRLSLGAQRVRLVRMLLTETLLLAAAAGAASVFIAWRLPEPLFRILAGRPAEFPMPPDWRTFGYIAAAVLFAGIAAGLAPALQSVKTDFTAALKGGAAPSRGIFGSGRPRRLQELLVSAQVAISMVLLVEAALFARAEDRNLRSDPGFLTRKVVVAPLFLPENTAIETAAARLLAITERVKALPGVRSVAFSEGIPLVTRTTVELRPPNRPDASQPVDVYTASPAFFETFGVRLLRGREFDLRDRASVVVSQTLAKAFWPAQDPIGKTVPVAGHLATVVGVVKDVDALRFGGSDNPAMYRPWRLSAVRNVLSVRFEAGASAGAAAVRSAIHALDPNMLVISRVAQTWVDQITEDLWNVVALIMMLGVIATLLATTGIYGAVSFAVSQRAKEMGIRVALGARRADIMREVFRSGGAPVIKGLLLGLWLSVAAAAGLRESLLGSPVRLDTANPLLYCGAVMLLATAALLAMVAPARRGANCDPLEALRCE